jgi:hypothetical protein
MKINEAFPSQYLKAADLNGRTPNVTIKEVSLETVGEDSKLVVYFNNSEKGLVLNKTNANTIADILGSEDTDDWPGKRIKLITAKVEYQGKRVPAIRVEEADANGHAAPAPRRQEPVTAPDESDVPF